MSNREEIQITDLEPSIEGGDDVEYIVQIRGIDATGRPGPWSDELKFTSPQQIPSLQSFNYVPGTGGWRLDNDGSFEVNDGTIRGTLESVNYVPDVSGWRLSPNGFAEFGTGIFRGALRIGQNTFNVDPSGNLYIGGTTPQNAPFSVDTNGQILAMDIDAGLITAGQIGANVVYAGQIFANQVSSAQGPFSDVLIPNLSANKITTGTLNANNVTISGTLSAVTLSGVGGTFSGNLTAATTTANGINTASLGADSVIARQTNLSIGAVGGTLTVSADSLNFNGVPTFNSSLQATAFRLGTTFPQIDTISGGHVRIRATGRFDMKADGGFRLEDGGIIGNNRNATGFNTVTASTFEGTGTNFGFQIRGQLTPLSGSTTVWIRTSTPNQWFWAYNSSSIKYKEDVHPAPKLDNILNLSPILYKDKYDEDENRPVHYGLIAEEVHDAGVFDLVEYREGEPENVKYDKIGVALIPYVKELYDRIEQLEEQLNGS